MLPETATPALKEIFNAERLQHIASEMSAVYPAFKAKAFLKHARLALMQVDAAVDTARAAAQPAKKTFALGFQTGLEMSWLPQTMHLLQDELKNIHVTESKYFQFRTDFLNTFNNVQLGHPNVSYNCPYGQECSSGTFGLINTSQPARNIQFAMKFYF